MKHKLLNQIKENLIVALHREGYRHAKWLDPDEKTVIQLSLTSEVEEQIIFGNTTLGSPELLIEFSQYQTDFILTQRYKINARALSVASTFQEKFVADMIIEKWSTIDELYIAITEKYGPELSSNL